VSRRTRRITRYSERIGVHWVWKGGGNSKGYPRLKVKGEWTCPDLTDIHEVG
jgi:hypothetical protein